MLNKEFFQDNKIKSKNEILERKFEIMLRNFDIPYKKLKSDGYLIGQDIIIRIIGDRKDLTGVEE